jgi:hypothetical protein
LISFCENKQFFVFEGPEMLPKNDKNKDNLLKTSKNIKTKLIYYIFRLNIVNITFGEGRLSHYRFNQYMMPIEPITNEKDRHRQNIIINSNG